MKLFYKDKEPDFEKIHQVTSKGYGIKHPERISGYAGAFLFTLLDVYVSDQLEQFLESTPEFSANLLNLLSRFKHEDYGEISSDEEFSNGEQRYIAGCHNYMIARYHTDVGKIIFESFFDMSLFYFDGEDITALKNSQEDKRNYARLHRSPSRAVISE